MGKMIGKGAMAAGAGGGMFGSVGGLVSALGLKALAIFSAGFLLVGSIGSWWFHSGAAANYYASLTTSGDITSITGDDASMIKSGNPVLVAIAMERHLKGSQLNDYDYNDPIMQPAIKYWKKICGTICSYALPTGMLDTGKGFDNCHTGGNSPSACGNGLQCAMFIDTVFAVAGHPLPAKGNAIDYWRNDQAAYEKAGWEYISNGSGMPSVGDLAVMDHGLYGHILVVVGVDLPQNGKKGAVYLAQANGPGNTEVSGTPLLKWPLRTDGFAEQTWSSAFSVMGFIHNDKLSQQWGDPFHSTGTYTPSGDGKCDKHARPLSEEQARALAQQAGFSGHNLDLVIAVAHAESGLNPKNCLVNTDSHRSIDRGIMQINNYWHSEVSDACAYDALCGFQQAYRISRHGTNFDAWYGYKSGNYLKFMP